MSLKLEIITHISINLTIMCMMHHQCHRTDILAAAAKAATNMAPARRTRHDARLKWC
jgi:hypothetical protein